MEGIASSTVGPHHVKRSFRGGWTSLEPRFILGFVAQAGVSRSIRIQLDGAAMMVHGLGRRMPGFRTRSLLVLALVVVAVAPVSSGCRRNPSQVDNDGPFSGKEIVAFRAKYDRAMATPVAGEMTETPQPTLLVRESTVGEAAADALARIGTQAVPALVDALQDPKPRVRELAALALARMGPEAETSVPELIMALQDSDLEVQRSAARALGQIGPEANQAIPALLETIRHEADLGVRTQTP